MTNEIKMTDEKKDHNISGVILAGGAGKRLNGIIKAKLVIHGKTVISMITDTLKDLFDEIIIVTNTPDEFKEYCMFKMFGDQYLNKGPLAGIHSAMTHSLCDTIFVVAGDMPLIEQDIIIRQIEFFYDNNFDVVIPRMNQFIEPLHGIYKKSLLRSLEQQLEGTNDNSIMSFLKKTNSGYLQFEESEKTKRAFLNINSSSDLIIVEKIAGLRNINSASGSENE